MSRPHSMTTLLLALSCYYQLKRITATTVSTTADNEYQNKIINCATNEPCAVTCQHMFACNNATINCPKSQTCDVTCSATFTCGNAVIHAEDSSFFRLLNCEAGSWTCIGINIYFPPRNAAGTPTSAIIGPDMGLSAGGGNAFPLQFYAINGWKDVDITTGATFSFDMHAGVMHCASDYSFSCDFASNAWSCANAYDTCNNPYATLNPTKKPTAVPTNKPTAAPTRYPTVSPITNTIDADCVGLSALDQASLNGNWKKNGESGGHNVYTIDGNYWLYYSMQNTHGYWMIGTVIGSVDWNDIYAYCFDEDVMKCSGEFLVRSDTGGAFVEDRDSAVDNQCTTTTVKPDDNGGNNNNNNNNNNNDDDNDEKSEGGGFTFPPKIVLGGYLIPWYLFLIVFLFLCMCCCICGMVCCKKRKEDKYKRVQDNRGDKVQMINRQQRQQMQHQQQRQQKQQQRGPYDQRSF